MGPAGQKDFHHEVEPQ